MGQESPGHLSLMPVAPDPGAGATAPSFWEGSPGQRGFPSGGEVGKWKMKQKKIHWSKGKGRGNAVKWAWRKTKASRVGVTVKKRVSQTETQHQSFSNDGHWCLETCQHDYKRKPKWATMLVNFWNITFQIKEVKQRSNLFIFYPSLCCSISNLRKAEAVKIFYDGSFINI